jgi:flagellar biogenesis protein FliO
VFAIKDSVASQKRKIIGLLMAASIGSGALILWTGQTAGEGENPKSEIQNSKQAVSTLFANDPNFAVRTDSGFSTREILTKLLLSVLAVGVLGAAAIYVSKKVLPKIGNLPGKRIHIIETVHLGPRKALHLVEVGNQQLLIGSTGEGITKLADVSFAFEELTAKGNVDNMEI